MKIFQLLYKRQVDHMRKSSHQQLGSNKQQVRLSFADEEVSSTEIFKEIFALSYLSIGDQQSKLNIIRQKLVVEKKWLSETQYKEILDLCWLLPGPTTVQVIVTIVTLKKKSIGMGIIASIIYNFMTWIILFLLGLFSDRFIGQYNTFSVYYKLLFLGCNVAAAGIMMRDFLFFFKIQSKSLSKILLTLLAAIIFVWFRSLNSLLFCLISGSIISLYLQFQEVKKKMSHKSEDLFNNIPYNFIFGKPAIYMLIGMFILLWLVSHILQSGYGYQFSFYFIGCMVIGPINSIFAYFLAILQSTQHISSVHLWLAIPISFMLPGTALNVGVYFGTVMCGFKGALISIVFLFLPCFLSLYGILPRWKYYRDKQGVQRLMSGLISITVGFDLAVIVLIFQHCLGIDFSSTICIFIVCAFFNYVFPEHTFLNILLGGFLANIRRIGLIDYRFMPDHDY